MSKQEDARSRFRILVADDEPVNIILIRRVLQRAGHAVTTVDNGLKAINKATEIDPDLIILDVMMPVMDGFEACTALKADPKTRDIPVMFLSSRDETDVKVSGLSLGANDYIIKPFKAEELLARVEVARRLKTERDRLRHSAEEAEAIAELAIERAMTDALTGLHNRYGLQRMLARELAEARRYGRPLSSLMLDFDKFKNVNDTYGHAAGDIALKQLSEILRTCVRKSDLVFRLGGEEFLILLPETDLVGATAAGEKVRLTIENYTFGEGELHFKATISIGAAMLEGAESGNDMIARADMALYTAKENGRNRVEAAAAA